jgi:hypothetical protein
MALKYTTPEAVSAESPASLTSSKESPSALEAEDQCTWKEITFPAGVKPGDDIDETLGIP